MPAKVDEQIGEAIRESGIPRSEIFITTKFWPHFAAPEYVELCLDQCLRNMGLDYIDLFLAHWPFAFKPISHDALKNAKANGSNEEKGILEDPKTGKRVIDWEHTSANIAQKAGMLHHMGEIVDLNADRIQAMKGVLSLPGSHSKLSSALARQELSEYLISLSLI